MKLTAENVNEVARHALFKDDEIEDGQTPPDGAIVIDGIVSKYAFHPGRIAARRADIAQMLDQLSDDFKTDGGGGMSFLNACMTKDGVHWGEHPTMGMLFALGEAAGLSKFLLPREMWNSFPGGMPYVAVDSAKLSEATNLH